MKAPRQPPPIRSAGPIEILSDFCPPTRGLTPPCSRAISGLRPSSVALRPGIERLSQFDSRCRPGQLRLRSVEQRSRRCSPTGDLAHALAAAMKSLTRPRPRLERRAGATYPASRSPRDPSAHQHPSGGGPPPEPAAAGSPARRVDRPHRSPGSMWVSSVASGPGSGRDPAPRVAYRTTAGVAPVMPCSRSCPQPRPGAPA